MWYRAELWEVIELIENYIELNDNSPNRSIEELV